MFEIVELRRFLGLRILDIFPPRVADPSNGWSDEWRLVVILIQKV